MVGGEVVYNSMIWFQYFTGPVPWLWSLLDLGFPHIKMRLEGQRGLKLGISIPQHSLGSGKVFPLRADREQNALGILLLFSCSCWKLEGIFIQSSS